MAAVVLLPSTSDPTISPALTEEMVYSGVLREGDEQQFLVAQPAALLVYVLNTSWVLITGAEYRLGNTLD